MCAEKKKGEEDLGKQRKEECGRSRGVLWLGRSVQGLSNGMTLLGINMTSASLLQGSPDNMTPDNMTIPLHDSFLVTEKVLLILEFRNHQLI